MVYHHVTFQQSEEFAPLAKIVMMGLTLFCFPKGYIAISY